ncbi:MAG: (Fe-S)-binding protein [Candidatus Bathyarchaeia archaeon]
MRPLDLRASIILCKRCGSCFRREYTTCPIYEEFGRIGPFSPPSIIYLADTIISKYLEASSELATIPFACTLCGYCSSDCGQLLLHVRWETPARLMEGIRSIFVESGALPANIAKTLNDLATFGNAWRLPAAARTEWEKDCSFKVPDYTRENNEYLLFVGDAAFIDETKPVVKSIAELLHVGGVSYGTLKDKEIDSGETARELGEYGLFEELAKKNIETFKKYEAEKIVTISPHDYNAFKVDYPKLGFKATVYHYTQLLNQLVKNRKLKPTKTLNKTVTYHDPCFLGRYHGIFEPPREILQAISGVKFVEMKRNRKVSFCCGGGGGRMWYDPQEPKSTRISDIRVSHATEVKADVIATSCPYCKSTIQASDNLGEIIVKDIAELLAEACL